MPQNPCVDGAAKIAQTLSTPDLMIIEANSGTAVPVGDSGLYDSNQMRAILVMCPTCGNVGYRTHAHGLYTGPCADCDRNAWLDWFHRKPSKLDAQGNLMTDP